MISEHPSFEPPLNKSIKIWRYMDLSKYLDILMHSRIFFPKAKHLGDPFENSTTRATEAQFDYIKAHRREDPRLDSFAKLPDEAIDKIREAMSGGRKNALEELFVNCWHMNEYESAGMWKLYSKSDESICIVSRYSDLAELLPGYCNLGRVHYVDYDSHVMNWGQGFTYITHKRKSFEHEREVRAVIWSKHNEAVLNHPTNQEDKNYKIEDLRRTHNSINEYGLYLNLEISKLINCVYVNPNSKIQFTDVVRDVTQRLGYKFPVLNSSIAGAPVF